MSGRNTYVVDIETVGQPWDEIDDKTREYLLGRAPSEAERESVPRRLGLHPGTGRIIVIGMLNVTAGTRGLFVEGSHRDWSDGQVEGFKRFDGSEEELLREFWKLVNTSNPRLVTFNGRMFDIPYLMLRSAIRGVAPSHNFMGSRYRMDRHVDLAEVLNFQGAVRTNFSLDYWCRRFGIDSPKDGIDGSQVQQVYEEGGIERIAEYCARDVVATAELFERLDATILRLF